MEALTFAAAVYDAAYLQMAQELHIRLATLDTKLARMAEVLGLKAARPEQLDH